MKVLVTVFSLGILSTSALANVDYTCQTASNVNANSYYYFVVNNNKKAGELKIPGERAPRALTCESTKSIPEDRNPVFLTCADKGYSVNLERAYGGIVLAKLYATNSTTPSTKLATLGCKLGILN